MQTLKLKPIRPGYAFVCPLQVSGTAPAMRDLTGARVVGQFRRRIGDTTVLATADTAAGTLAVTAPDTLELRLTKVQTAAFPAEGAHVDFVRFDGANPEPLPFQIRWPVLIPVTRGVSP